MRYSQRCAWGMVREKSDLKMRNVDGKVKKNLFPRVALQCMSPLQLSADENPGLLFYYRQKTVLIIYSSYN